MELLTAETYLLYALAASLPAAFSLGLPYETEKQQILGGMNITVWQRDQSVQITQGKPLLPAMKLTLAMGLIHIHVGVCFSSLLLITAHTILQKLGREQSKTYCKGQYVHAVKQIHV